MPKVNVKVPHNHGRDEASRRLKAAAEWLRERHGDKVSDLAEEWAEHGGTFRFSTFGMSINGALVVQETHVQVDVDLPFAAMMFKGKIEQEIRERLEKTLG